MSFPHYFESFDYAQMLRDFPIGDAFTDGFAKLSADEIRARQDALFRRCVARAWEIPFYQRLWRAAGAAAGRRARPRRPRAAARSSASPT